MYFLCRENPWRDHMYLIVIVWKAISMGKLDCNQIGAK